MKDPLKLQSMVLLCKPEQSGDKWVAWVLWKGQHAWLQSSHSRGLPVWWSCLLSQQLSAEEGLGSSGWPFDTAFVHKDPLFVKYASGFRDFEWGNQIWELMPGFTRASYKAKFLLSASWVLSWLKCILRLWV